MNLLRAAPTPEEVEIFVRSFAGWRPVALAILLEAGRPPVAETPEEFAAELERERA